MSRELTPGLVAAAFKEGPVTFPAECQQIADISWATLYIWLNQWQAQEIWLHYSGARDAQWLSTINPDTVKEALKEFVSYRLGVQVSEEA